MKFSNLPIGGEASAVPRKKTQVVKIFLTAIILSLAACIISSALAQEIHVNSKDSLRGPILTSLPDDVRTRLASLKVGMTRAQMTGNFESDGGIFIPFLQRYMIRGIEIDSKRVMLNLVFQPAGMSDAVYLDDKLRREWLRARPKYI